MRKRIAAFPIIAALALIWTGPVQIAAAAPIVVQPDPSIGPHARDEARHAGDRLAFTPAQTVPNRRSPARAATGPLQGAAAATSGNEGLRREVFGFAPYWAVSATSTAYTNWNYSLLSTVAFFGLTVDINGNFRTTLPNGQPDPGYAAWSSAQLVDMINRAHGAGDRVVLVIKAFDNGTICSVVYGAAPTAIANTIAAVQSKQLDGVNVDFEGSNTTCGNTQSLQAGVTSFMSQLSTRMHQAVPGSFVTIDTYSGAASWDGGEFKIGDLAPVVDAMFVMAYDMNVSNMRDAGGADHAGPTAPLNGWTYNDTTSVQQYLTKAPTWKVILGVPYYGYKWSTTTGQPYALTTGSVQADTYANVMADLRCSRAASQWDGTASSRWAAWFSPASGDPCGANYNSWRELYYDDATSLGLKYDLVNSSGLRGMGMWTLDYQGSSTDLWNEISLKFVSHWEPLGGPIASAPDVASWGANRLDAFVRGTDNALWHRFWDGTSWTWESLGGVISAEPGVVSSGTGRIDVFIRGQELKLWHRAYDAANGGWGSWEDLGGVLGAGPDASSSGPGQVDVFIRGTEGGLWHRSMSAGGWTDWQNVGRGAVFADKPSAVSANGRTDVFVHGTDRNLWHCSFDGTTCASWEMLGGPILDGPGASTWGPNRLDVFVRGTDSHLWHRWFNGSTWSSWSNAIGVAGYLNAGPSAVSPSPGRIDIFIRGFDSGLWHLGINIS
jgi:hypothetical protein